MIRNPLAALLVGPPVTALTLIGLVFILGLFGGGNPVEMLFAPPGFVPLALLAIAGSYLIGWLPALIGGLVNGIAQLLVSSTGARRAVAFVLGMLVMVGHAFFGPRLPGTPPPENVSLINLLPLILAGGVGGLASNAMAARFGRFWQGLGRP